jgi:PAS domain S-box-containing protein
MTAREREALFQTFFESSPDAIFIEDMAGNVLDCNPAAAALHRTTRETLIGKNVTELVPPERRKELFTLATKPEGEFEGFSLTEDGFSIPVSVRTSRIEYLGQPALLLHVRDNTERTAQLETANEILRNEIEQRNRSEEARRRLEEEVQAARKMEAVGRLAGGVAHDFNNLLTVIIGRCEVLLDRVGNSPTIRPDLLLICEAAQKAASVTRQLLAFSRKQVLQPQILSLNHVIQSMEQMLRSLISENIDMTFDLAKSLRSVEADRGQIEQVLMNLVVNALDAMSNGGTLSIRTANVGSEDVMLEVKDTGCGMDAETLSHIFEPFFTTKDKSKGTGLGLSTAYGIVQQSGGYISAESEPGHGTTLTIYLRGVHKQPTPLESVERIAARGSETILVAEDADLVRELTKEMLEVRGYHVIEAANGEEAVQICKSYSGRIHLALSDVVMPRMTGPEFAEQVARLRPDIKVLLMSGYTDNVSKAGFLQPGLHFIEKPFTSNALANKIREVLDQSE